MAKAALFTHEAFGTISFATKTESKIRQSTFASVAFCITLGKKSCVHVFQLLMEKADVLRDIKIIGGQIIKSERDESVIITARVYSIKIN